ncbi:MAG: response regulator [Thermoproteota archaeon]
MDPYDVVIIEDSPAICLRLKEFCQKLSFNKIHIAKNGTDGIKVFKEYMSAQKPPIVFLDYNLPDMDGLSVIEQILDLRPETKVILETAREKNDEKVKEVIAYGAYAYLAKPYSFENVRQIITTIRNEDAQLNDDVQNIEAIRMFLKNYSRISMAMLTECTGKSKAELTTILENFEKSGNIIKSGTIKEISCDKCGTVKVKQFFHCPSCYSFNFKKDRVIEHYNCGNVSPARTYKNEKCPACNDDIKVLGVDYRIIENFYFCNDCGDKFPELEWNFRCLNCNNKFDIDQASWRESLGYKIITI